MARARAALFLATFARAARRAARDADVVHAHWLSGGCSRARDAAARRADRARNGRGARAAGAAARTRDPPADERRARGVERARGGRAPASAPATFASSRTASSCREAVGEEAEPPEILFAGRLSREKGILELVEAARGHRLVVAGDGPLRDRVPDALGWLPPQELASLYARAAVVACPSHREGFGLACAEAMAHGRAVVASDVGGLRDLVVDGETGLLVPPRDVDALRAALERLLADPELRRRLGANARERVRERCSWPRVIDATLAAYEDALRRSG